MSETRAGEIEAPPPAQGRLSATTADRNGVVPAVCDTGQHDRGDVVGTRAEKACSPGWVAAPLGTEIDRTDQTAAGSNPAHGLSQDADPTLAVGEQRPGVQGGTSLPAATLWQCGVCGMETDSPGHAVLCGTSLADRLVPKASLDAIDLIREMVPHLSPEFCGRCEWLKEEGSRFLAAHALEGTL